MHAMHCINYNPYEIQTLFIEIMLGYVTWQTLDHASMNIHMIHGYELRKNHFWSTLFSILHLRTSKEDFWSTFKILKASSPSISGSSNLIPLTFLLPIYYSSWYGHRKDLSTMYKNSDEIKKKQFGPKFPFETSLWNNVVALRL